MTKTLRIVRDLLHMYLEQVNADREQIIAKKVLLIIFFEIFQQNPLSISVLNSNHYPKQVAGGDV
jgi:hypothetical protein